MIFIDVKTGLSIFNARNLIFTQKKHYIRENCQLGLIIREQKKNLSRYNQFHGLTHMPYND